MPVTQSSKKMPHYRFFRQFPKQKLTHLFYVFGQEEYLKAKVVNMVIDRAVPAAVRDFDYISLYIDDMSLSDAVEGFSTKPFMADHKVVFIRQFDKLKSTGQQQIIEEFVRINKENILLVTAEKFDSRLKVSKQFLKHGQVIECKRPYKAEDMIPWLNEEIRNNGKRIDYQASLLFVNKVNLDYYNAANELEKLLLYCHNKKDISLHDVQVCTGDSKTYNIFDLINHVGDKNLSQSLIIMGNLLDNREAPFLIITMLIRLFVQIWRVNLLRSNNCPDHAILTDHLKEIHQFFRKDYLKYANNYPLEIMPNVFSLLLEADTELKSVSIDENLILARMLFRLFALGN